MITETQSIVEKYGFTVCILKNDDPIIQYYLEAHKNRFGYPPDTVSYAQFWLGIARDGKAWGVLGGRRNDETHWEVTDLFTFPNRWGILAAYGLLEYAKAFIDDLPGHELTTLTPIWNTNQIKATLRVFGQTEPSHYLYRYKKET